MLANLNYDMVMSLTRHFLTLLGGVFLTLGYLDAGMVEAFTGAATTIIGTVWAVYNKKSATPPT